MGAGTLMERMHIELVEASAQRMVGRMPVEGNTQPYGLLHGGASAVLAETLGSVGAVLHAGSGRIAVGIELNVTHHRAVTQRVVTGVATPGAPGVDRGDVRSGDLRRERPPGGDRSADLPAAGVGAN